MKKLKMLLVVVTLSFAFAACGSEPVSDTFTESEFNELTDEEQEELIEERIAEIDAEEESKEIDEAEPTPMPQEAFECLAEVKEASLEDVVVQVEDRVFCLDGSMKFRDAVAYFENNDEYYIEDYSPDAEVSDFQFTTIYKGTEMYMQLIGKNINMDDWSAAPPTAASDEVVLRGISVFDEAATLNQYFYNGIPSTGDGFTEDMIKEIFADYADTFKEKMEQFCAYGKNAQEYKGIHLEINPKITKEDGTILELKYHFWFDSEGVCRRVAFVSSY